uniref:Uncharacterized protein n=1 Tax=Manihot esculenta TaxID=3983 RepID=A0A2C9WD47_MANES
MAVTHISPLHNRGRGHRSRLASLSHSCRSQLESLPDGRRSHLSLAQSW